MHACMHYIVGCWLCKYPHRCSMSGEMDKLLEPIPQARPVDQGGGRHSLSASQILNVTIFYSRTTTQIYFAVIVNSPLNLR